jgi:hypothetical protein
MILENTPLRIMGVDPGTGFIGLCICEIELDAALNFKGLLLEDAYTVKTERLVNRYYKEYAEKFGQRAALLKAGVNAILTYMDVWKPAFISYEDSYLGNRGGAQAFGSGKEIQALVIQSVRSIDPSIRIEIIEPSAAKKGIGVNGRSKFKKDIVTGLNNQPFLNKGAIDLDNLTDHACDSVMLATNLYKMLVQEIK